MRDAMLRPKLLLLDEPSFGLAPLGVQEIFRILRSINRNEDVSILLVERQFRAGRNGDVLNLHRLAPSATPESNWCRKPCISSPSIAEIGTAHSVVAGDDGRGAAHDNAPPFRSDRRNRRVRGRS